MICIHLCSGQPYCHRLVAGAIVSSEDHNENDNLPKKFKPLALQEFLSEYQPLSVDLSGTRRVNVT